MQMVFYAIEKAASVDFPVLIVGETGTGKELVAREIHERSTRNNKPFVAVNMAALPTELVSSELFGHEKGSFTGAADYRAGRFSEAQGGTLFLDEALTMEERVQTALLRVLETNKFRKVGGTNELDADVRILAAINEEPNQAVKTKRFRVDLLHRLQVIQITIPPLRRRKRDIPMLVQYFMEDICQNYDHIDVSVSQEALDILKNYDWPGNVRELRNTIFQAAVFIGRGEITPDILPEHLIQNEELENYQPSTAQPASMEQLPNQQSVMIQTEFQPNVGSVMSVTSEGVFLPLGLSLNEVQKVYVMKTLSLTGNNKSKAAKSLGLSRKTLYDKLVRWNVQDKEEIS